MGFATKLRFIVNFNHAYRARLCFYKKGDRLARFEIVQDLWITAASLIKLNVTPLSSVEFSSVF